MGPIRVAVADDDDEFRAAVSDVLGADPRFEVVAAVPDGETLVSVLRAGTQADVVLLDVRMPGGGVEGVEALAAIRPTPAVLAISAHTSPTQVLPLLAAGAVGYLGKGRLGAHLSELVACVTEGNSVLAFNGAPAMLSRLAREHGREPMAEVDDVVR